MNRRALLVRLFALLWLMFVWILLWGNVSAGNILAGLGVGLAITFLLPLPRVPVEGRVHPLSLLHLIAVMFWEMAKSSVQVAWLAIRPSPPPVTGVLRHQFAIRSDLVLTLCVDVLNLIPGTMVLEIDQVRRICYIHVLDVGSDRAVDQFHRTVERIEQLFIASFERPADWQPSPYSQSRLDHDTEASS
ncbi:Na+/H+ antiporter subunit E [Rhodococcus sp. HNM0569]|uniref:Na+/H+ antiporter subunit E n=1 Tax=Rhodococcus sp. HNM0569 TaxID=2716340 RepID=UPI00146BB5CE|nr:Na+/H+ antiporter subunit E [Rhodococcus sp. HNM0569]NLU83142.1 Na+/H+ antiporter subunit E [Rhodococcus sp. HNM0569]